MRSPRSPRTSALRVSAVAVSGFLALAVLTGCNDDDKGKSPNGLDISVPPIPSVPDFKIPDINVPSINVPSIDVDGSSTATPSPGGTASLPDEVDAVDLKAGECIDISSSKISKKSCSVPHDAQVAGVGTISDSLDPESTAFEDANDTDCEQMASKIINRQSNPDNFGMTWYAPTPDSWEAGDRTLQCMIIRQDKTKLTEKLI
ncbi:septum formation family protein [Yinghuangia sp. ASG 101]|uniref:septum formation family protein n=1 Tax=Yinghuangia sp. ASG 101 TaxID=2896848 RepID=UPI001E4F0C48|nr:septum formation family protein [Yinghuangia sp. ASG 101]UGQ13136.1 septum formation family protein [Yinghuangia sp. ASG 101]